MPAAGLSDFHAWCAALVVGALHAWEVSCYHHPLDNLSVPEQKVVALKTENAFYYSYYEELVLAPSLAEGLGSALRDVRSETPDVINAIHRFNIYQELLCGALYRLLREALGEAVVLDSWYFFRYCSYVLQGVGQAALVLLAWGIGGGGLRGGAVPTVLLAFFLFLHRKDMGRIHDVGMLNLRENWAMPVILLQVLALQRALAAHPALLAVRGGGRPDSAYQSWVWVFRASTVACLVLWQFSAFAFVLQVAAVFLCALLPCRPEPRQALQSVLVSHLGCAAVAAVLLFGNELLVHHMLVTECAAILLVLRWRRPSRWRVLFWVDGALALAIFAALRVLQSRWATAEEHIAEIFLAKARQIAPQLLSAARAEPTFNARLYFAVSVFDFIDMDTVMSGVPTGLYHCACCGAAVWAAAFAGSCLPGRSAGRAHEPKDLQQRREEGASPAGAAAATGSGGTDGSGGRRAEGGDEGLRRRGAGKAVKARASSPAVVEARPVEAQGAAGPADEGGGLEEADDCAEAFSYGVLLVQLVFLLALGCFISRLKVLGGPFLCLLAALSAAPRPLELALALAPSPCAGKASSSSSGRCGRLCRGGALAVAAAAQLVQLAFLGSKLPFLEGRGLDTHRDLIWSDGERGELYQWMVRHLHPQAAVIASMPLSAELRLNTPFRLAIHPQFESKSLRDRVQEIYEFYMCTPPERVAGTMQKYGSSHIVLEYKRCDFSPFLLDTHPELNCVKGQRDWKEIFCPAAHSSPHFRLLFANAGYAVLRLANASEVSEAKRGRARDIEDIEAWRPMLDRCLAEEPEQCVSRTAELASMFFSKMGQRRLAAPLLSWARQHAGANGEAQYILGHHLDYDAKQPGEAAAYYKRAYALAPNNPLIAREYLMWLDLEARDNRTLEELLRPRRSTRGSRRSFLELGDVTLACEASVPALELLRDRDWSEELWGFAVRHGHGSQCVRNNWPLFNDGQSMEAALGPWGLFRGVFWERRIRSELASITSSGVRYQHPRAPWVFGPRAGVAAATTPAGA